jgi:hypothetical protein
MDMYIHNEQLEGMENSKILWAMKKTQFCWNPAEIIKETHNSMTYFIISIMLFSLEMFNNLVTMAHEDLT